MNFYELLYAGKNSGALSATYYELLFAKYLNPGGGDEWATYDGTLPAQYTANGDYLANYRIYGASSGVGDRTENLFDKNATDVETGYYYNEVNVKQESIYHNESGYIPVTAGSYTFYVEKYNSRSYSCFINFYDTNKNFVRNLLNLANPNGSYPVTIPNDGYVRFNETPVIAKDYMLVYGSTAPASYIPYGYEVDMSITGNIYNPAATDPNNGYMSGYYMQATGEPAVNNAWHITEYIPIDPTKKYVVDYAQQGYYTGMAFYDLQKNYLSGQGYMAQKPFTLTVPQNAAYARFSIINSEYYQTPTIKESEIIAIYIGSDPLGEDEYIDYKSGKIYRKTDNLIPAPEVRKLTDGELTVEVTDEGEWRYTVSNTTQESRECIFDVTPFTFPQGTTWGGDGVFKLWYGNGSRRIGIFFLGDDGSEDIWIPRGSGDNIYRDLAQDGEFLCTKIKILTEYGQTPISGFLRPMLVNTGIDPQTFVPHVEPEDPPVPLPALPTVDSVTITDYAGQSAAVPSRFYAKYKKG